MGFWAIFLRICLPFHLLSLLANLATVVEGTISPAFANFLNNYYGPETEALIARRDLGQSGSFGGGKGREKNRRRPVIFVHGLLGYAGILDPIRKLFREKGGYQDSELYATTYSYGKKQWLRDRMECRHVKQVRLLIEAVLRYTRSQQIDLIGYSMGSPIARKAILGGRCVDSGEWLGARLSHLVHTFIGVAGANRGAHICQLIPWAGPCNPTNGLRCHSNFLDDINSVRGYEASGRIFTIHSVDDGIVGNLDCDGFPISAIDGQHGEIILHGSSHLWVYVGSAEEQLKLLSWAYRRK